MYFIGHKTGKLVAFDCDYIPTEKSHGHLYGAVIGSFKTRRAQKWAEQYGYMNPHFYHVDDAERISKINH